MPPVPKQDDGSTSCNGCLSRCITPLKFACLFNAYLIFWYNLYYSSIVRGDRKFWVRYILKIIIELLHFSQSQEVSSKHQSTLPSRDIRPCRTHRSVRVLRLWKVCFPLWNHLTNVSCELFRVEKLFTFKNLCKCFNFLLFTYPLKLSLLLFTLLSMFFSPVPKLRWRKVDGLMPSKAGASAESSTLILPELSFDDEGVYECEAYNSEGSDKYQGRISVQGRDKFLWKQCEYCRKIKYCVLSCLSVMF